MPTNCFTNDRSKIELLQADRANLHFFFYINTDYGCRHQLIKMRNINLFLFHIALVGPFSLLSSFFSIEEDYKEDSNGYEQSSSHITQYKKNIGG